MHSLKNESSEILSSVDEGSLEKYLIIFTALKLCCYKYDFHMQQNADSRLAGKRKALPQRLLCIDRKHNYKLLEYRHGSPSPFSSQLPFLSLSSVQNFVPGFPAQSPCYALSFELQTIDDIFPAAVEIRWFIVYIMASPRGAHNESVPSTPLREGPEEKQVLINNCSIFHPHGQAQIRHIARSR